MAAFELRYARAFHQVVSSSGLNPEQVRHQLGDFQGTFAGSHELREFLSNPSLSQAQKLQVLDAVGSRVGLDKPVRNFIAVLMDHGRLSSLAEIIREYETIEDEANGISEVEILSARPLSNDEQDTLGAKAAELAGTRVRVAWKQDTSLLGGAVIRVGSRVYDGSVRAQLEGMKQHLAGTR